MPGFGAVFDSFFVFVLVFGSFLVRSVCGIGSVCGSSIFIIRLSRIGISSGQSCSQGDKLIYSVRFTILCTQSFVSEKMGAEFKLVFTFLYLDVLNEKLDMLHDNFVTSYSYSYLLPPSQK